MKGTISYSPLLQDYEEKNTLSRKESIGNTKIKDNWEEKVVDLLENIVQSFSPVFFLFAVPFVIYLIIQIAQITTP